jgi:hypothetical protein
MSVDPRKASKTLTSVSMIATVLIISITSFSARVAALPSNSLVREDDYNAKIEAFIKEFDEVSKEMADALSSNSVPEGVDQAQKSLDAKKDSLREKFAGFKNAKSEEVSEVVLKKLTDSITSNGKASFDAFTKHQSEYERDPEAYTKFQKLMNDYTGIFKM